MRTFKYLSENFRDSPHENAEIELKVRTAVLQFVSEQVLKGGGEIRTSCRVRKYNY